MAPLTAICDRGGVFRSHPHSPDVLGIAIDGPIQPWLAAMWLLRCSDVQALPIFYFVLYHFFFGPDVRHSAVIPETGGVGDQSEGMMVDTAILEPTLEGVPVPLIPALPSSPLWRVFCVIPVVHHDCSFAKQESSSYTCLLSSLLCPSL